MLVTRHYVNVDFGTEEAEELKEEIEWLKENSSPLERIEYEDGIRFFVPDIIFKVWVDKFDIQTWKGEPMA